MKRYLLLIIILIIIQIIAVSCIKKENQNVNIKENSNVKTDYGVIQNDSTKTSDSISEIKSYHWVNSKNMPPVVIVIDDFGQISGKLLQGFLELDENVCFAVLPDLPHTQQTAKQASIYRHEVIVHIPMEALDKTQNPGKRYLKASFSADETSELVDSFIKQIPQAIGVNNHMGSRATSDEAVMQTLMKTLKSNRLFFLDSRTSSESKAAISALKYNVDCVSRDIFLDVPDVSSETLNNKLKDLEKFRGRIEPVIIISHCHNAQKLIAVNTFISQLKAMGIALVPLSEAVEISNRAI